MSSSRPESHVAQQIRRDKLRIQNSSHYFPDFPPSNTEPLSLQHPGLNSDFLQVRSFRNSNMLYEPAFYAPEIASFSTPSNTLSPEGEEVKPSRLMLPHYASFHSSPASETAPPSSAGDQPRDNMGYDWMINYGSSSGVNVTNDSNNNFATDLNNNNLYVYQHLAKVGEMHNHSSSSPPPFLPNTLHDIVKYASISAHGSDHIASHMENPGHGIWTGNENHSNNPQGLSLSLSSSDGHGSREPDQRCGKSAKSVTKDSGKSLQDVVVGGVTSGTTSGYRSSNNVGPLGPFTGYATILKSSRFLEPAQELMDEFCNVCGSNCSDFSRRVVSGETEAVINNNAGGASCSDLYNSKENSGDCESSRGNFDCSARSLYNQKKARLLYMQEEVTRKHKQYHQQMQLVVSSFESVAGLSSATPYVSVALKSVARQFGILKNAIMDQIKHSRDMLGEDLSGSTPGTISKLETGFAYLDQSFQKSKTAFLEPQQVWRPQRGLPERAVAILKAWLFEHFLHPYPTDTDKHMLATQTGLSRNQVSNWFINARVRVWKPMVEEIHNLETKGVMGGNQNEGITSGAEGSSQQTMVGETPQAKYGRRGDIMMQERQFQCLGMSSSGGGNSEGVGFLMGSSEEWNEEKRSKLECHQITPNMDGTLMGFVPYRRGGGLDVGGLGSVSLTLGLRHGVEGVQQQLHQEDQIRRQFGEHMIHDFVG